MHASPSKSRFQKRTGSSSTRSASETTSFSTNQQSKEDQRKNHVDIEAVLQRVARKLDLTPLLPANVSSDGTEKVDGAAVLQSSSNLGVCFA